MKIIKATYGGKDCLDSILGKVSHERLIVKSSNNIIGDTNYGVRKFLEIDIENNNKIEHFQIEEGSWFAYPKTKTGRLGVFYSNNNNQVIRSSILASLQSIRIAAEKSGVDILTSMWISEPENPFYETISWTKHCSHLNQILQILQLLYLARKIDKYKYVSFLEHDVMYPEDYFEYANFNNEVICNMNYMGMNEDGFQPLGQKETPLHQFTMGFDFAIKHFESLLPNALVSNDGNVEPKNIDYVRWESKNPPIHINHGYHFTSHFSIYRRDATFKEHPYWGDHNKFLHLFKK